MQFGRLNGEIFFIYRKIFYQSLNRVYRRLNGEVKGPFTWKEDDPSARIILESSFGLHAKTRLLGSTLNLVYMKFTCKILCSARLKQDGGRKGQKVSFRSSSLFTRFDNRLSASICHYIQLDISNTATASYDSPSKSHCHHFKVSNSEEEDQTWKFEIVGL